MGRLPDASLPDDCFAVGDRLLSIEEALAEFQARLAVVAGVETVPLATAEGRFLAEDLVAGRSVPPHANAAVDGYAVHFDDLRPDAPVTLTVTGRAAAGHPLGRAGGRGEAIRIFTGAPMPAGPDTVVMQEDCAVAGDTVTIPPRLPRGANVRQAGEDIRAGDTVLTAGRRLGPAEIGLAASLGRVALPVRRPLRIALFSTGDEVRDPGTPIADGQIYDANRFVLAALLRRLGCGVDDHGILPDRAAAIQSALATAAGAADAIVTSGGVSDGDEDHVKAALEAAGGRLHHWRLAIKPGRPVALGQIGGVPLLGLPGNPVAVMVTFLLVARPILLRLAGAEIPPLRRFAVAAGFTHSKKPERREFIRAVLETDPAGTLVARRHGGEGSADLTSMAGAEGLVELGEDLTRVAPGDAVAFIPMATLL
ncbi:molybdopterin molybdotransferase [Inquilinus ginsengisoli]|uniref:Molybdopterin molybdenumtransferase n=1 Tax=Inquilinus ginsengisoli TaxID=363840 RepID=A0ABU1JJB5_9PROT|nr:gephyrin-like molybdotransferase Glp [Inquilinus ginsengisoli]MDR6288701.1 molybdopterin molybdotransferase [Inquilinus ginsengisoli]